MMVMICRDEDGEMLMLIIVICWDEDGERAASIVCL